MMRVLIVGGGVTGISLSFGLQKRNVEVKLLDKGENVSSRVAAGIINPLVFRRMTLSWRVAELLPFAVSFYRELETQLNCEFLHELKIRRLFASEQERNFWIERQHQEAFSPYMETLSDADMNFPLEQNTFGTARLKQAHYVDTEVFLNNTLEFLHTNKLAETTVFDYEQLDPVTGTYLGETYDYIVFAEGKDGFDNPYFNYLPLQQTKGEVLTLYSDTFPEAESLNRKCFLLPIGNHTFKAGSTYVWDVDDTTPTQKGRETILENLKSITNHSFEVRNHQAGVRPTVPDRRPLIGKHPEFPKLVNANGLGAKGFLLAPKIMDELVEHLLYDKELHPECSFSRLKK